MTKPFTAATKPFTAAFIARAIRARRLQALHAAEQARHKALKTIERSSPR